MKTQTSFSHSGFTMFEIMITIAIIAIVFGFMSRINFRAQENITKAERMANKVQSVLHSSSVAVLTGRMDPSDESVPGVKLISTGATIRIDSSGSLMGQNINWQTTKNLTGSFLPPFFDNDPRYEINSMSWCSNTSSGTIDSVEIQIGRDATTFTGSGIPPSAYQLEIRVRYINFAKKVVFDKRTGRIEIRRDGQLTTCF